MSAILLIRHGQASFGAADYDALSPLGERQARLLGTALGHRGLVPTRVVCGAMRRHRQTAEGCLSALGAKCEWEVDAGWNEYDHNDVLAALDARYRDHGALAADLAARPDPRVAFQQLFERAMARWVSGRHDDYHESWRAFHARVAAALERLRAAVQRHQTVLVFTSGGAIASACRAVLRLDDAQTLALNWSLVNASASKFVVGRGGDLRLSSFNDHGDLETEAVRRGERLVTYR